MGSTLAQSRQGHQPLVACRTHLLARSSGISLASSRTAALRRGRGEIVCCVQFSAFEAYAAEVGVTVAVTPETQNGNYESWVRREFDCQVHTEGRR